MKKLSLLIIATLLLQKPYSQAIKISDITNKNIDCGYKGKVEKAYEIWDKQGVHLFFLTKEEKGTFGEADYVSNIYVYKKTNDHGGYIDRWEVKEFNPNGLTSVDFNLDKTKIVDIDKDGIAETIFLYHISPDGLDPIILKMICHYKNKKYVISGEIPQMEGGSYTKNMDKSFDNLPDNVRKYISDYWNEIIAEIKKKNGA